MTIETTGTKRLVGGFQGGEWHGNPGVESFLVGELGGLVTRAVKSRLDPSLEEKECQLEGGQNLYMN